MIAIPFACWLDEQRQQRNNVFVISSTFAWIEIDGNSSNGRSWSLIVVVGWGFETFDWDEDDDGDDVGDGDDLNMLTMPKLVD